MHQRRIHARGYAGKLSPAEERLAQHILAEIAARGPLMSDEIADDGRATTAWVPTAAPRKPCLRNFLCTGAFSSPPGVTSAVCMTCPSACCPPRCSPPPTVCAGRRALACPRPAAPASACRAEKDRTAAGRRLRATVRIDGGPPLYCLREDVSRWDELSTLNLPLPTSAAASRLLAPLDPLIYDRRLTQRLWDFDYTWEVYTPAHKRTRGYYALPVLAGDQLVGHVDPKADRPRRRLIVVSRRLRRGHQAAAAVRELAQFLGLR